MLVAPVVAGREAALRSLLASMNKSAGVIDPFNTLVPFGQLDQVHFARYVILDDATVDDVTAYGMPRPAYSLSLFSPSSTETWMTSSPTSSSAQAMDCGRFSPAAAWLPATTSFGG